MAVQNGELAFDAIIGASAAVRDAKGLAQRVAASPIEVVLLVGETGTGKELFARGIHEAAGNATEPFVAVNCATLPPTLLETELFGHERGAFTDARTQKRGLLELAGTGTIFLDELTELRPDLQAKLLRVLENRQFRRVGGERELPVRCRIILATNRRLDELVGSGEFREDLFYRVSIFRVDVPALREREGDVELLAGHFLREFVAEHGRGPEEFDEDAVRVLTAHNWPGNVRELKNVVARAAVLCDGDRVQAEHVMIQRRAWVSESGRGEWAGEIRIPVEGMALSAIEREAVRITLAITRGNRTEAAKRLGISRPTLLRKLRPPERESPPGFSGEGGRP